MATFESKMRGTGETTLACGNDAAAAAGHAAAYGINTSRAARSDQTLAISVRPLDDKFQPCGEWEEYHVTGRLQWETTEVRRAAPG